MNLFPKAKISAHEFAQLKQRITNLETKASEIKKKLFDIENRMNETERKVQVLTLKFL